jgi:hypothetical protein
MIACPAETFKPDAGHDGGLPNAFARWGPGCERGER